MSITAGTAQALIAAALAHAAEKGHTISVAVVDSGGFLKAFARADQAGAYTADVALGKAYGVVFMDRSSADLRDLAEARPQFFDAVKNLGLRTLIPSPGGVPLPGGAIGVSGAADPNEDVEIAMAAIAAAGLDR
jgi:uncharacterized protein GlcG (DUF336 family)